MTLRTRDTQVATPEQLMDGPIGDRDCQPLPFSLAMMDGAVVIGDGLRDDVQSFDLPFLGAPYDIDATGRPYVPTSDEVGGGFGLGGEPIMGPASSSQGPSMISEIDMSSPTYCLPGHQDSSAESLPNLNKPCDVTPSEPNRSPTRPERRTSSASSSASVDPIGGMPDVKHHRERNRVAARKCRQRARQNVAGLQQREKELSQQNRALLGYVGSLREEILDLKNEILRHSECDSGVIQEYIANAARRQMG
ncbi:hypothetical protein F4777DRAFT_235516 [Nemania sp. FL0916]|nr:hypothetical protein F4777DRAFT_235516 [Nemania sp. FL0916]